MKIKARFSGTDMADVEGSSLLTFPEGLLGLPDEQGFLLLQHRNSEHIAWLQSTKTPSLALPVVSWHVFGPRSLTTELLQAIDEAHPGEGIESLVVMVTLCAPSGQPATVNLVAPIIVNTTTRRAVQVILKGAPYSTRELFVVPGASLEPASVPAPELAQPPTSERDST
jgi:flagellar assembly factor FliW